MKFAHITDVHLGAFTERELRDASVEAFRTAMETATEAGVKFVLITGDLFHNPVPDMGVARKAASIIRRAHDHGIKIFMVYGSHDYSAVSSSMIDILEGAGLITKVMRLHDGKLAPYVDRELGVSLYGIDARKNGLDRNLWKSIAGIEEPAEGTVPIMLLHTAINELLPRELAMIEALSISDLPAGMSYYATGHIHYPARASKDGAPVVQPGALFGSDYRDLENTAKGVKRGFYIVDTDNMKTDFVEVKVAPVVLVRVDMNGKQASEAYAEAIKASQGKEKGAVVLLHLEGRLAGGKPSELSLHKIKRDLMAAGARAVITNESRLEFPEAQAAKFTGTPDEIERQVLEQKIAGAPVKVLGLKEAMALMDVLSGQKEEGEKNDDYEERIVKAALHVLGVDDQ